MKNIRTTTKILIGIALILMVLWGIVSYGERVPNRPIVSYEEKTADIPQEQETNNNVIDEETIKEYERIAQDGDNKAKFELATKYYRAGTEEYYKKAFELFSQLNKEKVECANVALGVLYYEGKGVEKDAKKAFNYWNKGNCAKDYGLMFPGITYQYWFEYLKNTKQAQKMYEEGMKCLDRKCSYPHPDSCGDCIPAFDFFTAASDLGHMEAKYELGSMHFWEHNECCGYCLEGSDSYGGIDNEKAFNFFTQAAKGGSINAMRDLGYMYLKGYNTDNKDSREAKKWFLKAVNAGDSSSMFYLSKMYFRGFGVEKDWAQVKHFAEMAIQKGEDGANYYLGMLYYDGKGVKKDYKKALQLFERAAYSDSGHEIDLAKDILYTMYLNGQGTKTDEEKAKKYGNNNYYFISSNFGGHSIAYYEELKDLAAKGDTKAQFELAKANYEGENSREICNGKGDYCVELFLSKDYKKAFYWYQKAFEQGSSEAAIKLSEMYEQGKYVKQDLNKAKELKEIAEQEEMYKTRIRKIIDDIYSMPYLDREDYLDKHYSGDYSSEEMEKFLYLSSYLSDEKEDMEELLDIENIDYKRYEKLANKGDNFAQLIMGNKFYKGIGVKQDFKKAFEYFSKASKTQRCAEVAMGNMYFKGEGVEQNTQKAIDLWTKDVDNEQYYDDSDDSSDDMVSFFDAKLEFRSLITYPIEAFVLFEELAKQGNPAHQTKLGEMYKAEHSDLLPHELLWESRSGQMRGEYWLKRAVEQGYRDAYVELAKLYSDYWGPMSYRENYNTSIECEDLMEEAFKNGSTRVYNQEGDSNLYCYNVSSGVIYRSYGCIGEEDPSSYPVDYKRAYEYYSKTAELGDPYGLYHIGLLYDGGYGVEKDTKKALEYYNKAIANINFVSDMRPKRMANMYHQFGKRLIELGKTKEAKIVLNKSIELGNKKSKELLKKIK